MTIRQLMCRNMYFGRGLIGLKWNWEAWNQMKLSTGKYSGDWGFAISIGPRENYATFWRWTVIVFKDRNV